MSLDDFASISPAPQRILLVSHDEDFNVVWVGRLPRFVVRSGPPCFVFDKDLKLRAWANETGEGGDVDRLLQKAWTEGAPIRFSDGVTHVRTHTRH